MNFEQFYINRLKIKGYTADNSQLHASKALENKYLNWLDNKNKKTIISKVSKLIHKIFVNKNNLLDKNNHGIYFWGGVGRGKSFLMDSFYNYLNENNVNNFNITRIHFHEFMRNIHRELELLRGNTNPIDIIAKKISTQYHIICFDEFHINDIADAMIFNTLFNALFQYDIFFILTSNYHIDNLYLDGLHRDRFLPAIDLLNRNLSVINLDGGNDYRLRSLEQINIYHTPINDDTHNILLTNFHKLIIDEKDIAEDSYIAIENRKIHVLYKCGDVVWFDFQELCNSPRSQNDYLEIALQFKHIILSNVPYMPPNMSTAARRFTWLIDILYDNKVKLIISAHVEANKLYTEGLLSNEFHRTVSRIIEMQSKEYLKS